jgi:hypothetical protein
MIAKIAATVGFGSYKALTDLKLAIPVEIMGKRRRA